MRKGKGEGFRVFVVVLAAQGCDSSLGLRNLSTSLEIGSEESRGYWQFTLQQKATALKGYRQRVSLEIGRNMGKDFLHKDLKVKLLFPSCSAPEAANHCPYKSFLAVYPCSWTSCMESQKLCRTLWPNWEEGRRKTSETQWTDLKGTSKYKSSNSISHSEHQRA